MIINQHKGTLPKALHIKLDHSHPSYRSKPNSARNTNVLRYHSPDHQSNTPFYTESPHFMTEPSQTLPTMHTDFRTMEDSTFTKLSSHVKRFDDFFQQNFRHLSENSLKCIDYDIIDHLGSYAQSSASGVVTDEQRGLLMNIGRSLTDSKCSSERKAINQTTLTSFLSGKGVQESIVVLQRTSRKAKTVREKTIELQEGRNTVAGNMEEESKEKESILMKRVASPRSDGIFQSEPERDLKTSKMKSSLFRLEKESHKAKEIPILQTGRKQETLQTLTEPDCPLVSERKNTMPSLRSAALEAKIVCSPKQTIESKLEALEFVLGSNRNNTEKRKEENIKTSKRSSKEKPVQNEKKAVLKKQPNRKFHVSIDGVQQIFKDRQIELAKLETLPLQHQELQQMRNNKKKKNTSVPGGKIQTQNPTPSRSQGKKILNLQQFEVQSQLIAQTERNEGDKIIILQRKNPPQENSGILQQAQSQSQVMSPNQIKSIVISQRKFSDEKSTLPTLKGEIKNEDTTATTHSRKNPDLDIIFTSLNEVQGIHQPQQSQTSSVILSPNLKPKKIVFKQIKTEKNQVKNRNKSKSISCEEQEDNEEKEKEDIQQAHKESEKQAEKEGLNKQVIEKQVEQQQEEETEKHEKPKKEGKAAVRLNCELEPQESEESPMTSPGSARTKELDPLVEMGVWPSVITLEERAEAEEETISFVKETEKRKTQDQKKTPGGEEGKKFGCFNFGRKHKNLKHSKTISYLQLFSANSEAKNQKMNREIEFLVKIEEKMNSQIGNCYGGLKTQSKIHSSIFKPVSSNPKEEINENAQESLNEISQKPPLRTLTSRISESEEINMEVHDQERATWRPIHKPHVIKNWTITVNINPPIEEASLHMEESVLPLGGLANNGDISEYIGERKKDYVLGSDDNPILTGIPSLSTFAKPMQYTFELNTRKPDDEMEETNSIVDDHQPEINQGNQQQQQTSRRNTLKVENVGTQRFTDCDLDSMKKEMAGDFFKFVRKMISDPCSQRRKEGKAEAAVSFTNNNDNFRKTVLTGAKAFFKYSPRKMEIASIFFEEIKIPLEVLYKSLVNEPEADEQALEDPPRRLLKWKGSGKIPIFELQSSSLISTRITQYSCAPILKFIDGQTIQQLGKKEDFLHYLSVQSLNALPADCDFVGIDQLARKMNDYNWVFLKTVFMKLYCEYLNGCFEHRVKMTGGSLLIQLNENIIPTEDKAPIPEKVTKRKLIFPNQTFFVSLRSLKTMKNSLNREQTNSNTISLAPTPMHRVETKKNTIEEEEKEIQPKQQQEPEQGQTEKSSPLKDQESPILDLKYVAIQRRHSKAMMKPATLSAGTGTGNEPHRTNLEKCKTVTPFEPISTPEKALTSSNTLQETQIETLQDPFLTKGRTVTIASEEETNETSHQLQIPARGLLVSQSRLNSPRSNEKEQEKKRFSTLEKQRTRKNIFTVSNTLNSSRKSSPRSESQLRNSVVFRDIQHPEKSVTGISNGNVKGSCIKKKEEIHPLPVEIKLDNMFTSRRSREENIAPTPRKSREDIQNLPFTPRRSRDENTIMFKLPTSFSPNKTVLSSKALSHIVPFIKKRKEEIQSKLVEGGPKQALFYAAHNNQQQEIQEMFELYPREAVNIRDDNQSTLLIIAAKAGNQELVKVLLEKNIDLNSQDVDGNTALHYALSYSNFKVADALIASGAKQNIRNKRGKTAWDECA